MSRQHRGGDWQGTDGDTRSRRLRADSRGQTVLDYGIAAGIFIVALVFVLGTIPGIFSPFLGNTGETQTADRVAKSLSADMLGAAQTPYVLNATCTEAFFDQLKAGNETPDTCRFDTNATDLQTMLALDSTTGIRVEITTQDGTVATLNGTTFSAGESQPGRTTVTSSRRTVGIDNEIYTLEVVVW